MEFAKRWIALLLALVMTVGMFPATAVSAEEITAITEETQPVQTEPTAAELPETVPTVPDITLPAEVIPEETEPAETVPETTAPAKTVISQTPAATAEVLSGTCGTNLTWTLDDEGTLTISGTGAMTDYWSIGDNAPWYYNKSQIKALVVEEGVTSISDGTFAYCYDLAQVTIPSTMVSIGDNAFLNTGLTSLVLTEGVASIGKSAFSNCNQLVTVELPESLTSIGESAFSNCNRLTTANVPGGIKEIPKWMFNYCGALTTITISEGLTSIGENAFYMCRKLTTVTLPSTLETIGDSAFYSCEKLGYLELPDSLTTIDEEAFSACYELNIPKLPASLTSVGRMAFRLCHALTELTFPEGMETIGDSAFESCNGLISVTIPATVTSIGDRAFSDCSKLMAIHVAEGNKKYASQGGVLFNADKTALMCYPSGKTDTEYTIPATVTTLNEYVFSENLQLTKVTVPGSIAVIPQYAFYCTSDLTEVVLNEGIMEIGQTAFYGTGLTSVTLPDSLTTIGNHAFYNTKLKSVSIGKNVTAIGERAFDYIYDLTEIKVAEDNTAFTSVDGILMNKDKTAMVQVPDGVTSVVVPETVTALAPLQFYDCQKLTSVVLPDGITEISDDCFSHCYALKELTLPESITSIGHTAFQSSGLTSITFPAALTSIGDSAFDYCSSLKEIHFQGDAPTISDSAFGNAYNTWGQVSATAYYPGDNATWTEDKLQNYGGNLIWLVEGAVKILYSGFCSDDNNVTWKLDEEGTLTISGIGTMTGYNSYRMVPWDQYRATVTKVVVEEGVTSIGGYAFYNMPNLTEVTLPNTLATIEKEAFWSCDSLPSVVIPDSVTTIGPEAFAYCPKLETVTMGSNITSISGSSFEGTPWYNNLTAEDGFVILGGILLEYRGEDTEITVPSTVRILSEGVFRSRDNIVKVVLPASVTEIHKNAFYGCSALKEINIPAGVKQIGEYVFYNCTSLESIDLSGVTQIGNQAFRKCESLQQVTFGNGLTSIGSNAFYGCSALKDIVMPGSLTKLDSSAFAYCTSLTSITIPSGLQETGSSAFQGCKALKTVNLGDGLRVIASGMFANCTSLEYIHIPLNIVSIKSSAFRGCRKLATVDFAGAARGPVLMGGVEDEDWPGGPGGGTGGGGTGEGGNYYPSAGSELEINNYAFENCTSLVDVHLPSHLTYLSSVAFRGASNTEFFYVNSTAYINDAFGCVYQKTGTILVCVPAKLSGHYVIDPNATEVYADFNGCADLEGITFSTGAGGIHGEGAFAGCSSLSKVVAGKSNQKGYSNDAAGALLWKSGSSTYLCFVPANATTYTIPANVTNIYSSALANANLKSISVAEGSKSYSVRDGILYSADGKTLVLYPSGKSDASYVVPVEVEKLASGSFARAEKLEELWLTGEPLDFTSGIFGGSAEEMAESGNVGSSISLKFWYPENIWGGYIEELGYFFGDGIETCPYLIYTAGQDDAITVDAGKPMAVRTERDITTLKNVYVDNEKVSTDNYTVVPNGNFILFANSYLETIMLGDHSIRIDFADGSEEIGTNDPRLSQAEFEEMLVQAEANGETCYLTTEVILERDLTVNCALDLTEGGAIVVSEGATLTVEGIIRMEDGGSLTILEGGKLELKEKITVYNGAVLTNQGILAIKAGALLLNIAQLNNENEIHVYGVLRNNRNLVNNGTILVDGSERIGLLENNGLISNNGSILLVAEGRFEGEGGVNGNYPIVQEAPVYRVEITGETEVKGGGSITMEAALLPENQTNTTIKWSVDDPTLVTLKTKGNTATLTAADVSELRNVTVTARSADGEAKRDTITVTIVPKVKSISIWPEGYYYYPVLTQGRDTAPIQLNAEVAPAGADSEVIWTSSDEDVATVSGTGLVTFTNETGDVTITATSTENSKVKATIDYKVIEPVIMRPKDNKTSIELVGGKSTTLTIVDGDGNKVKNISWDLVKLVEDAGGSKYYEPTREFDEYVSISSSGKLTAKKVVKKVELGVRAMVVVDDVPVNSIIYNVTIYPQVSKVDIISDKTVFDWNESSELNLTAVLYPTDVADEDRTVDVKWDVKGNMVTGQENGNLLKLSLIEHKAGTVTVKATAQDDSKKSATLKIQVGAFADKITIDAGGQTELKSGEKLTMTATVRGKNGRFELSNPGVTWSLSKEDKSFASLSVDKKTGAATLKAKSVYTDKTVTVIATSKDGKVTAKYAVAIKPANVSFLTIQSPDYGNVTKETVTLNLTDKDSITLYAADYTSEDDALSGITWSPNKDKKKTYTVSFDKEAGTMTLTMLKGGSVKVTAKTADKKKSATVTIKAVELVQGISIQEKKTGNTNLTVAARKSLNLEVIPTNPSATNKKVTWRLAEGGEKWAAISSSGKLTAKKEIMIPQTVTVIAEAQDGSGVKGELKVAIMPAITNMEIRLNLLTNGVTKVLTEKQITGWAHYPDETVTMSAIAYPTNADQRVQWKSSNKNILDIHPESGLVTFGTKGGTVTITATAMDGSNKKATFKLKVLIPLWSVAEEDQDHIRIENGVIAGGKTLKLSTLTRNTNANATSKKLYYEIMGGDGAAFASVDKSGKLKTQKVTGRKTVNLMAFDEYGFFAEPFTVTICPETTWIDLTARRSPSSPFVDVTGQTIELPVGERLYLQAGSLPGNAWDTYKWEVKNIQHGGFVMPDGNLAGGAVMSEVTVMGDVPGKTLTVTATAMDGTNKKATVRINIVEEEPDTVEISMIAAEYGNQTADWWADTAAEFNKAHEDINLKVDVVSWNDIYTVINTRIANGEAPDILNIDIFEDFQADGLLLPVKDYMSDETYAKFYPQLLEESKIGNTVWAVPDLAATRALLYNKDIFANLGILPPSNWEELENVSKIIHEAYPDIAPLGVDMTTDEGQTTFALYAWNNGGGFTDARGNWKLNTTANAETIEFLVDMVEKCYTNIDPSTQTRYDLLDMFATGQLAMTLQPNNIRTSMWGEMQVDYGIVPIPTNNASGSVSLAVMDRMMCFDNNQSKKELEAIRTFFDFFYEDERYADWTSMEDFLPATSTGCDALAVKDPAQAVWGDILESARLYPIGKEGWYDVKFGVIDALQRTLLGENAMDVLNALQREIAG